MTRRLLIVSPNDPRQKETYVATQITALGQIGWDVISAYHVTKGRGMPDGGDHKFLAVPVDATTTPKSALERTSKVVATQLRGNSEQADDDELGRWREAISTVAPDCILVQFGPVAARMLPALRSCGIPWAIQFHGFDLTLRCIHWGYRRTLATLLGATGAAFVPSAFLDRELRRYIRASDVDKIHRVSPGYDEAIFNPIMQPPSRDSCFRLVSVGRLVRVKGHDLVIEAVARASESVDLTIIGDGEEHDALTELIKEFDVAHRVRLAGPLTPKGVREAFGVADGFIQLSTTTPQGQREGLGLSPIEAAATGLPVIVSNSGGLAETCINGETGIIVPDRDVEAAASAIRQLAGDPVKAKAMGAAGARWVAATYASVRQATLADAVLRLL